MATNATTNTHRFTFEFTGNPTTTTAKMKSLAGVGTFLVAQDHILVSYMPGAFNEAQGGKMAVRAVDVHKMVLPAVYYTPDASEGGLHFVFGAR